MLTAGESHGPKLTVILEGMPAGLPISTNILNQGLARRQHGCGAGPRMSIEKDEIKIISGVLQGKTTGSPIALEIQNQDFINWQGKSLVPITIPRPGHADLTGAAKYGYKDLRLPMERSSARETAARVAAAGICRIFLRLLGIQVGGYVIQIGQIRWDNTTILLSNEFKAAIEERLQASEQSEVRCPDKAVSIAMQQAIQAAQEAGDSLGGIIEVLACNVPPGLGSFVHFDRRLDSQLAAGLMSIPAIKGIAIGNAFGNAAKFGSEINDPIVLKDGHLIRTSNHAGGIEGGISNGEPIVVQVAMKPIPTFPKGLPSVDLANGQPAQSPFYRGDCCPVARAVPVIEAMMVFVLTNALLEKLGGDSIAEILPRFQVLHKMQLDDFSMDTQPWTFDVF